MVEGRGCRSYLLTYELVQTQVDIETPQMVVKQWSVGTACILKPLPLIVTFCNGLNMLLLFFIFLFFYIQSCSFFPLFYFFRLDSYGGIQLWFIDLLVAICKPIVIGWRLTHMRLQCSHCLFGPVKQLVLSSAKSEQHCLWLAVMESSLFYVNGDWWHVWHSLQFLTKSIDGCSQ